MLDARFLHLCFCRSLYTLQRGLTAIAGILVVFCCYATGCVLSGEYRFLMGRRFVACGGALRP